MELEDDLICTGLDLTLNGTDQEISGGNVTVQNFTKVVTVADTLTIDKALQGSLHQASDRAGGTMLTFGTNTSHGVDIRGLAALPSSNIVWA